MLELLSRLIMIILQKTAAEASDLCSVGQSVCAGPGRGDGGRDDLPPQQPGDHQHRGLPAQPPQDLHGGHRADHSGSQVTSML